MKTRVNLYEICKIFTEKPSLFENTSTKEYLGIKDTKDHEFSTLNSLCKFLWSKHDYHHIFENYYINYKIPQIGKEFDLLRIGTNLILNIELKSQMVTEDKILKQLEKNYYYLSFLEKDTHCFTFITDGANSRLFYYNPEKKSLEENSDNEKILGFIESIDDNEEQNIDSLFIPSNYLISPFNQTDKFIEGKYFLTHQQEEIKNEIFEKINKGCANTIFSISGTAGTGKTLLTYDIAKKLRDEYRVTIIHCAQTNNGIKKLKNDHKWSIKVIKEYSKDSSSDILIFDESHRLTSVQLSQIIKNNNGYIIFSHDINQKLDKTKKSVKVVESIEESAGENKYSLTNKIRHNESMSSFIRKFFNPNTIKEDQLTKNDYKDISIYFTAYLHDAQNYIKRLASLGWEYIYLTNSLYENEKLDNLIFDSENSAHEAIGQEYENVVVAIDDEFKYNRNSQLYCKTNYYYAATQTLFQAMTRTRKKLTLVIINNEDIYKQCIKILNREVKILEEDKQSIQV